MNQKLIVAMAVFLIMVGGFGIFFFSGQNPETATTIKEKTPAVPLVAVELTLTNQDLKAGTIIQPQHIKKQRLELEPGQWLPEEQQAGKANLVDFVVLEDISANSRLRSSQVAAPGSPTYLAQMVTPGYSARMFKIDEQQLTQLSSVRAGEFIDIYFRYHMDIPDYRTEIKTDPTPEIKRIGRFNGTRLLPIFSNKKMLYMEKKNGLISELTDNVTGKTSKSNPPPEEGTRMYIELDKQDIKKIYSIEAYGSFVLLPASFQTNQSMSASKVLPETIRQLKGKKQGDK